MLTNDSRAISQIPPTPSSAVTSTVASQYQVRRRRAARSRTAMDRGAMVVFMPVSSPGQIPPVTSGWAGRFMAVNHSDGRM